MQWKIFMCIKLFTYEYDRRCDYDSLFNYMFLLSLNKLDPFVFDLNLFLTFDLFWLGSTRFLNDDRTPVLIVTTTVQILLNNYTIGET